MRPDKQRVGAAFARHYEHYEQAAVVQREMADRLAEALVEVAPQLRVRRALEIGVGTGFLTRRLTALYPDAEWWFNDLSPAAFNWLPVGLAQSNTLEGDAEALPYPAGLDLLAGASALQWFDNLAGFFPKARAVMHPGGVLAIACFGQEHFRELATLAGSPLHYPALSQLGEMATRAGFRILHTGEWRHPLFFDSARALLDHLRRTGVNGGGGKSVHIATPAALLAFEERYRSAYAATTNGQLPLTYHPLLLIAQAS